MCQEPNFLSGTFFLHKNLSPFKGSKFRIYLFYDLEPFHTIQKPQKMAGQNTFQILFLNDANMIGEH
jgi:hypothetical protein